MRLRSDSRRAAVRQLTVLCLLLLGPAGCGLVARAGKGLTDSIPLGRGKRDGGSEADPRAEPAPLGEVSFVDAKARFVLVRTGRTLTLKTGAALEARRDQERVAELSYSPENRRGFLVADILRGNPAVGDLVMLHGEEWAEMEEARRKAVARQEEHQRAEKEANRERARKRQGKRR